MRIRYELKEIFCFRQCLRGCTLGPRAPGMTSRIPSAQPLTSGTDERSPNNTIRKKDPEIGTHKNGKSKEDY
jgi:hypothetical protein